MSKYHDVLIHTFSIWSGNNGNHDILWENDFSVWSAKKETTTYPISVYELPYFITGEIRTFFEWLKKTPGMDCTIITMETRKPVTYHQHTKVSVCQVMTEIYARFIKHEHATLCRLKL